MKRKLLFIFLLAGIIGTILIIFKVLANRSPKEGELRIESTPAVSAFLDNKHLGKTPIREKVVAGEHTLKFMSESTAESVAGWEGKITVGQNLLTFVRADLAESELSSAVDVLWLEKVSNRKSELYIVTNPDGATVVLDEEARGVTPLTIQDVTAGDHNLTITSPGFTDRQLRVRTTAGYKLIASLKLALGVGLTPPEATGSPTPSATPTKASGAISDPPKPFVIIKDTPTGFLRVRTDPSTAATEAARVKPGEKYSLLEEQSGWYQIKYDTTNTGWISGQYADKVE